MHGHEVLLVAIDSGTERWWQDCKTLEQAWKVVDAVDDSFDIVLEVGYHLLNPSVRGGKRHIWFCRKPALLHDIEASLFPFTKPERDLSGVAEVWVPTEISTSDDIQYLELLTRKPVRTIPWMWSPSAVEAHRREQQSPVWSQVSEMDQHRGLPWSVHICETHTSSSSSSTIPLFIMREVKRSGVAMLAPMVKIHNADSVKQAQFYRFNILGHCLSDMQDISCNFIGRQRIIDFVYDPKSFVIAHSRFLSVRPYVLEALWCGIPVVHNSKLVAALGGAAELGYYPDNDLIAGRDAFGCLVQRRESVKGSGALDELTEMRKTIMVLYSPMNQDRSRAVVAACESVLASKIQVQPKVEAQPKVQQMIRIGFCDMWDAFRAESNPFVSMVQASGVRGCVGVDLGSVAPGAESVDLVIFGPFGTRWMSVKPGIPLVHYTGENTDPIQDPRVSLNLGFKRLNGTPNYLRLPLWMLEINWFGVDPESFGNPKPIPIDRCCKIVPQELLEHRKKFCAFVVSNPKQPVRNTAFQWLSNYKSVDSAGRLFNNVGESIFAGLGGGGGELKKMEFLKSYKFCLAYENDSSEGYTTEKLLHAKASGCIPIYWGDPTADQDIDFNGVIDARKFKTAEELVTAVKEVDEDDQKWLLKYAVPALDAKKRDAARETLSLVAKRLLQLSGVSPEESELCPRLLGGATDEEAKRILADARSKIPSSSAVVPFTKKSEQKSEQLSPADFKDMVFVTGASASHLASLQLWLKSIQPQKNAFPEIQAIVYLMEDIGEAVEKELKATFPFAQTRRFSKETPQEFPDFWAPQHFGWKLWALREVVKEESMRGKAILYTDAGVMLCRIPYDWLSRAKKNGMSMLLDPNNDNAHWCSEASQKAMKMSEEELKGSQIWAGALAFVGGHPLAVETFEEAFQWAQNRSVLAGEKNSGLGADKKSFGHRHDQSILSVLRMRKGIEGFDLDKVHNYISLRQTYLKGASLYVHRGRFVMHSQVAKGIDDIWVVNLDRRADRLTKFKTMLEGTCRSKHIGEVLLTRLLRLPAFDGKKLQITPKLARLFKPHDFNWKKPVMGCALSHLALWMQLVNDKPDINSYFVCEDDARLAPDWKERWEESFDSLPSDWDIVYLGGILPPNREALESMAVEKVAPGVARIRANSIFGQNPPTRYFHWCTYAYVVSRRGAQKLLEVVKARDGVWTSVDHVICGSYPAVNMYFLHPLPAGCYQDDDPVYQQSAFNDFSRVDSFDSDLWNNTERFSDSEVDSVLNESDPLDIAGALMDARSSQMDSPPAPAPAVVAAAPAASAPTPPVTQTPGKRRLVSVAGPPMDTKGWYETEWFQEILPQVDLVVERIPDGSPPPTDKPIVVLQRPHTFDAMKVLKGWKEAGAEFYVLHLSDEYGQDSVECYAWPECLGVLRNYVRGDLEWSEKIRWMPLGPHWMSKGGVQEKKYVWSFVGTRWANREAKLAPLEGIPGDHKCVWMDDWNSPKQIPRDEMLQILEQSWMVPCPSGQNYESFRIYEALCAGALPVFVSEEVGKPFLHQLSKWIPLLVADSWPKVAQTIHTLRTKPEIYEQVRVQTMAGWEKLKADVKESVKKVFNV